MQGLVDRGAEVAGPAGDIDDASGLIDETAKLGGAVLDPGLRGALAHPVADALMDRGIPFVFATGHDKAHVATRYAEVMGCAKPVDASERARALFDRGRTALAEAPAGPQTDYTRRLVRAASGTAT